MLRQYLLRDRNVGIGSTAPLNLRNREIPLPDPKAGIRIGSYEQNRDLRDPAIAICIQLLLGWSGRVGIVHSLARMRERLAWASLLSYGDNLRASLQTLPPQKQTRETRPVRPYRRPESFDGFLYNGPCVAKGGIDHLFRFGICEAPAF